MKKLFIVIDDDKSKDLDDYDRRSEVTKWFNNIFSSLKYGYKHRRVDIHSQEDADETLVLLLQSLNNITTNHTELHNMIDACDVTVQLTIQPIQHPQLRYISKSYTGPCFRQTIPIHRDNIPIHTIEEGIRLLYQTTSDSPSSEGIELDITIDYVLEYALEHGLIKSSNAKPPQERVHHIYNILNTHRRKLLYTWILVMR